MSGARKYGRSLWILSLSNLVGGGIYLITGFPLPLYFIMLVVLIFRFGGWPFLAFATEVAAILVFDSYNPGMIDDQPVQFLVSVAMIEMGLVVFGILVDFVSSEQVA